MTNFLKKNSYKVLNKYFDKKIFLKICINSIYKNIKIISGLKIANKVKEKGLEKIHDYFPVEFIPFLQHAVHIDLKKTLHEQMFKISKNNFRIKNSFFIDNTLNFRFHYPFANEKKSILTRKIFRCLNLDNYSSAQKEFSLAKEKSKNYKFDESDKTKINYFKTNNSSLYLHSPHRDTWFAHSTEGVNFWWGISKVSDLNGMMMFQKVYKHNLEHEVNPAYVKDFYNLGKFIVPKLKAGDLLVFDAEILHASRINTSNETRIVFSGRINIKEPKFYKFTRQVKEPFWLKSEDVKNKNFDNLVCFKREKKNIIKYTLKKLKKNKIKTIYVNSKFLKNKTYKLNKINKREKSFKIIVKFNNTKVGFVKNKKDLFAFNALCPHLNFNLLNSETNNNKVKCQGHGLEFDLKTGFSSCNKFKLKNFKILEQNNYYFLQS